MQQYRPLQVLIPQDWTTATATANGIEQHYWRTGGRKPPLLLLHGFMEAGITWLRVARALAGDYDVILPDARFHGESESPAAGFSPELLRDDAAALIEALDLDPPILVGRSNGAVTAALVAAQRPGLARAVALVEPPAGGMPRPAMSEEDLRQSNWFESWLRWARSLGPMAHKERLASLAARWPAGLPVPPDEPPWPEDDFVSYLAALARFDTGIFDLNPGYWSLLPYLEETATIACPVVLLGGDVQMGSMVSDDVARQLLDGWAQGQMARIEGAGHLVSHGRAYERFMQALNRFLEQLS